MKAQTKQWFGVDVDLDISLHEYGFILRKSTYNAYPDEYFALFTTEHGFDTGHYRESELDGIILGTEWADNKSIAGFLQYVGIATAKEWVKLPIQHKVSDLLSYYGRENIFGTSYTTLTEDEANAIINQ